MIVPMGANLRQRGVGVRDPYRALALAVLHRAVLDANGFTSPHVTRPHRAALRQEARAFLQPSNPLLRFWADVADVDAATVAAAAHTPPPGSDVYLARAGRAHPGTAAEAPA